MNVIYIYIYVWGQRHFVSLCLVCLASAFASERTSQLLPIYQREQPAVVLCWFLSFSLMSTSVSFTFVFSTLLLDVVVRHVLLNTFSKRYVVDFWLRVGWVGLT